MQTFSFGITELRVGSIANSASFYKALIGLEEIGSLPGVLVLGWKGSPILRLLEDAAALPELPGSAGLYHLALKFTSKSMLAHVLDRMLRQSPKYFEGSSDHLVSEAFYFSDPDGNGVELYADRPQEAWEYIDGKLAMAVQPLDPESFIRRNFSPDGDGQISMGHLHLRVGDVTQAATFYKDVLGFDLVMALPQAMFLSYDGYHHHIGLNAWESSGAGERSEGGLGLVSFTCLFPKRVFGGVVKRLGSKASKVSDTHFQTKDPWGTTVHIVQAS